MKPKNKDSKNKEVNQEAVARMRAENSILEQHKNIKIIQFLNIADNSLHQNCAVDINQPIFQPEPKVILFTDYEPLQILTKILKLRNRDIVPRRVNIVHPENRLFQVTSYRKDPNKSNDSAGLVLKNSTTELSNTKVAPGMEVSYLIKFTPEAKVDVSYDLVVITEREKFLVPIRGIGCKAMLDFMDFIDFGEVPVKYKVEKPMILRNVGEKITKWMLKCSSQNISVNKKEGILDVGKSEQIICAFCPQEEGIYEGKMILTYDEYDVTINVMGKSKNDDVRLSLNKIKLEDAYITLQSQSIIQIVNNTSVPIDFVWKKHPSKEKEEEAKRKVFDTLHQKESEEKILNELQFNYEEVVGEDNTSIDLEDSYDEEEIIKINERNHMKSQNIIARRFEKIKKSLIEDQICFEDDNFQLEPISGKIWPNTQMSINITFKPEKSKLYKSKAYCDVTGLDKRLKLKMIGTGIGPKAKLSFNEVNLLDIAITDKKAPIDQKLVITNIGVIDCEFEIESPNTPCAKQFHFRQGKGIIRARSDKDSGELSIPIDFYAERLGEFSEKFLVRIIKSGTVLPVVFKGHVIAPFCKFSKERIDFAKVSLGFNSYETVDLINCSKVSIEYSLRISTDSRDSEKIETIFIIDKKNGVIHPDQMETIKIQFKPEDERSYDVVILMDMVGIGFDMLTLPVTAICEIPEVIIEPSTMLDFGDVFIRKEEYRKIKLTNTSTALCAQFHVLPQDESSKSWGIIMCEAESGVIEPEQTFTLNVAMKAVRLNKISLKLEIRCKTKNSDKDSSYISTINILAFSNGPSVKVENDRTDFDFGTVEVLKEKEQKITLYNTTPIDAFYTAFMKNTNSIFKIVDKTGKINKNDSITLVIVCKPDDNLKIMETMYFKIDEGKDFEIVLRCRGEGTTIVISNEVKNINFGTMFTMKEKEIPLYFENRGRSPLYIYWVARKKDKKKQIDSGKNSNKDQEEEEIIFSINHMKPSKPLGNKRCFDFIMKAVSKNKGLFQEIFDVYSRKESENTGIKITESVLVTAQFIEPKLEFYPPHKLNFNYCFDKDYEQDYISKTLTIKNSEELRAEFTASASPLFRIDKEFFIIEPHQSETIRVDFITTQCKLKKKIDTLHGSINVEHKNHDSIDVYPLEVSINFPNLKDMPSEINFGCLLNDTYTKKLLTLESNSDLDVTYEWILIELENSYEAIKKTRQDKKIPLNEIFSIIPMNGKLRSGETETAEITFVPGPNQRYNAIARCIVEGGPEYDVKLIGEASDIKYKIIANEGTEIFDMPKGEIKIAFGEIPFNVASKIDMVIKNDGEVNFSYKISYNTDKMRYLSLSSYYDTISRGESKKIYIEMIPGVPDFIDDEISIEIAHFEPIKVKIRAIGIYHGIIFSLNRLEPDFQERMFEAKTELELRKKKSEEYFPKKKANVTVPVRAKTNQDQKKSISVNVSEIAEIEMEANRKSLCKKLTEKISKGEILSSQSSNSLKLISNKPAYSAAQREAQLAAFLKDSKVATYTCDLGNIIAGRSFDYNFNVYNYNKVPLMFLVDKKLMSELGYVITTNSNNDRIYLDPFTMITITVTHKTNPRNLEKVSQILKFVMKDGETYEVDLNSFVTIPELRISSTNIEFNRVYIGRKKVVKFRIENIRQVACKWRIDNKDVSSKQTEREEKREDKSVFFISQASGKLEPGKKQTLVAYFIPTKEKEYTSKYAFVIEESARPIEFFLKGRGQNLGLEIIPETVDIGPVLPYFKYAYNFIELYNPNDIDIEVYSLDFDNQYLKEEEIIRNYKALSKNISNSIDLPIRKPGEPIWPKLDRYYQSLHQQISQIKTAVEKYNSDPDNPTIELSERHIDRLDMKIPEEEDEIKIPLPIDRGDKFNIILIGPKMSGKSSVCREQRKHHYRGVVAISSLYEWNLENNFMPTIERAKGYLEERKKELEIIKLEREKLLKQAKLNKKLKVDDTPIDEKKYTYLSKEIMIDLLKNRLSQEDCNVGVVFDDFESQYVENEEILLEIVDEALKEENIILAYFDFPHDENQDEVCNIIEWSKRPKRIIKEEKPEEKSKIKEKDRKRKTIVPKSIPKFSERTVSKPVPENKSHIFLESLLKEFTKANENKTSSPKCWSIEEKSAYITKKNQMINKMYALNELRLKDYEEQRIFFENDSQKESLIINSSLVLENVSKIPTYPSMVNNSMISLRPVERVTKLVEFEYQITALLNSYLNIIPKPLLPDPEDLPTPPDEEYQIIKKSPIRPERTPIQSFFLKGIHPDYSKNSIEEIIQNLIEQDKKLEEHKLKEAQAIATKDKQKPKITNTKTKDVVNHVVPLEFKQKEILIDQTRWIIKKNERVRLLVGFYTKEIGKKTQHIAIEVMTYPPVQKRINLNGIADYPSLSTNPMNIKMIKAGTIGLFRNKKNVIEEDFGSILITKDDKRVNERYKETNCKVLRFTNNGQFDVKVDFVFLSSLNVENLGFPVPFLFGSQGDSSESSNTTHTQNKAGARFSIIQHEPISPFILVKNSFDIKKDETILLDVYTFPSRAVEYKDELICLIKDNPQPIRISLTCKGVEPKYELESDFLDFEKSIINQPVQRQIRLKNVSEVNCKWSLVNPNKKIPNQLKFDAVNGVIDKSREIYINVTYCSEIQEMFNYDLTLEVEDNLGYGVKTTHRNIKFKAEAFKVNVVINNDNKTIDFGNVKVRDYKSVPFTLKNLGIYKIKYKFDIVKKSWQDIFKFEPPEGEIEPNKEKNMLAIFLPHPKQINISQIKNGSEIKLYIYEGEKNIKYQEVPIFVNVASHFSQYTLNPTKVINFGSMQYGETQIRSIEIRNEGQFDFSYEISEFLDELTMKKIKEEKDLKEIEEQKLKEHDMKEALESMGKGVKKDIKKPQNQQQQLNKNQKKVEDGLKISRFMIVNHKGVVAPSSSAKIDIKFIAEGKSEDHKTIAIDIQGRPPYDHPLGIPFDLIGESCIPGIDTKDYDNIFEEQTVLTSLRPDINKQTVITSGIFASEENVFWFGTVIASKNPNGVTERFKLINNNKIPCNVKVNVKTRNNTKSEDFEIAHKTPLKIYPNESEYVSITFKPKNVIPYSGFFEAIVEGGELNKESGVLSFELRGECTLPSILIQSPQEYDADGTPIIRFKKTRVTKSSVAMINLKNEGVVPATVKFDSITNPYFYFDSSKTATIQPKNYQSFEIQFEPRNVGIEKAVLQYKTLHNPYENPKLYLMGEGFFEPISIDNLLNDNELNYGDICIGNTKTLEFTILNHSDNVYRFNWLNVYEPNLELVPSTGILLPKSTKTIQASFYARDSVKYVMKDLYVELKMIKFTSQLEDWDNSKIISRKVTQSELQSLLTKRQEEYLKRKEDTEILVNSLSGNKAKLANLSAKRSDLGKKLVDNLKSSTYFREEANINYEEVLPEPSYTIIDKSEKYNSIKLTAVSDYSRYDCKLKEIKFKPTTMYDSRKHEFQLRNTSAISLNYNFTFLNPNTALSTNQLSISNAMIGLDKSDCGPFSVFPKSRIIPANSDDIITVRFSPTEIDENNFRRLLVCNIKDLDPNLKDIQIELSGDAERPLCHFETQEGIRHENGLRIVEFESIGMMVKNTKRFFVLNPTNQGYEFEWEEQDSDLIPSINKVFKCLTPKGVIFSGKKFEMIFEYIPNSLSTHESYWNFRINSEKIYEKFVLIGTTREPMILFNVNKINFGPLLLGGKNKEIIQIVNEEHLPYKFMFDKDSIKGNNTYGDSLIISPISGTLQPKSSTPIEVTFMPRVEKEFNYNLVLKVKQRMKYLSLNVKGVGYTISHGVYLDNKPEFKLIAKQDHLIDFGEFFINEQRERSIIIKNNGSFNFHFAFKKNGAEYLKITPESDTVKKNSEMVVTFTFLPLNKINLHNHKVFLQIVSGPTYSFVLNAKARFPQIVFSSISCNFGPTCVMRQPQPTVQIITVKNMDKEALTIETNFDNKNQEYLDVLLSTGQVILPFISPADILEIPIVFIPRDYVKYKDVITFKFNGIYDVDVEVLGEGIPVKVELEEPSMQTLDFGIIQQGQSKKLNFAVVNRGKSNISLQFYPDNPINFAKKCLSMTCLSEELAGEEKLENKIFIAEPRDIIRFEVLFDPNIRIASLSEDIVMKINNCDVKRMVMVKGASYGVDVKLVGDIPSFGSVVAKSMTIRQVVLRNFGDIPAKFKWEQPSELERNYTKFFTFVPASAVIPPHDDLTLDIIFHPKEPDNNIAFEKIKCFIDNGDKEDPLFLTLSLYGKSIDIPNDLVKEDKIETSVRTPLVKEIKIKNPSEKLWRITPSISSPVEQYVSYFKGHHTLEIKPGTEGVYTLTYLPLTMSKLPTSKLPEKIHEASVFFPLPDGSARVYKFHGISNPPKPKDIQVEVKAREWKIIPIMVNNWLYQTQRFKVSFGDNLDQGIFLKGANTIDIASNTTKEYKLSFRSWKELQLTISINFENVETKEYFVYQLHTVVTQADPYHITELTGVVRELATSTITVANPLKIPVQIQPTQIYCDNEYVIIKPNSFKIIPESEIPIEISYRPLVETKYNANIIIKSQELGELKYPLLLKGLAGNQLKPLQPIVAYLGSDKIINFKFIHYLKKQTVYTVKVEKLVETNPTPIEFIPETATITAAIPTDPFKGLEISSAIRYEPYMIYESKAVLKVSSLEGGEYTWLLSGQPLPAQAQGPYKIPIGKTFTLDFRNPLNEPCEIMARFDNTNFSFGGKINNRIESKALIKITIGYKAGLDSNNTGRLIITLNKLPPWVYYLQAE